MKIKENIKKLFKDKNAFCIFIVSINLIGFHIWQYTQSGNLGSLIHIIMYSVFSLTVLLFGKKALFFDLIIFSLVASYFNTFINFTSFFVLLLSCRIYRKSEKYLLVIYVINESIALMVQHKSISHLIIHFITCAFFYTIYFYINKPKVLELTADEIAILEELKAGKMQKEIDLYSKNIITKKIQEAKLRNKINTTEELVARYSID